MPVQKISYANKRYGDLWTSQEVNEIKSVVNGNADILEAQQTALDNMSDTLDATLEQHAQNTEALRVLTESNVTQVFLTQAQYDALVANEQVQEDVLYNIYE
jgi:hypothetical protein